MSVPARWEGVWSSPESPRKVPFATKYQTESKTLRKDALATSKTTIPAKIRGVYRQYAHIPIQRKHTLRTHPSSEFCGRTTTGEDWPDTGTLAIEETKTGTRAVNGGNPVRRSKSNRDDQGANTKTDGHANCSIFSLDTNTPHTTVSTGDRAATVSRPAFSSPADTNLAPQCVPLGKTRLPRRNTARQCRLELRGKTQ